MAEIALAGATAVLRQTIGVLGNLVFREGKGFLGCLKSATCIVCYGYDAHNFVVEIEGIKRRVEDINRVRQTYGINESSGSGRRDMWDERRCFPHIDEPNVAGFEKHIEDLHIQTWDAIKNAIPTNMKNGSRIILTSQNNDVDTHVGGKSSLHELQPLNEENNKKLFFKMVMVETSDPPQLENIGEQILKRCGGVLLAIVLAAGLLLLRERSENAWKGILEGMGQDEDQCSEIFGLTEGFILGSGVREVEDVGDDYLNHLIARNLIQVVQRRFDGEARSCLIHDILHNLCIQEAKEIKFFNTQNDVIIFNLGMGVRRVTTHVLGSSK
ncbi:unnamed protein product [Camellia sinensis]